MLKNIKHSFSFFLYILIISQLSNAADLVIKNEKSGAVVAFREDGDIITSLSSKENAAINKNVDDGFLYFKYKETDYMQFTNDDFVVAEDIRKRPGQASWDYYFPTSPIAFVDNSNIQALLTGNTGEFPGGILFRAFNSDFIDPPSGPQPNNIKVFTYHPEGTKVATSFSDGLGKTLQTQANISSYQYLLSGVYYDNIGRESKTVKGMPSITGGKFVPMNQNNIINMSNDYWNTKTGDTRAFNETKYYSDPLNRLKESATMGADFDMISGHTTKKWYFGTQTSTGFIPLDSLDDDYLDTRGHSGNRFHLEVTRDANSNYSQIISNIKEQAVGKWFYDAPSETEIVSKYTYDLNGNIIREDMPLEGFYNEFSYNHLGQLIEEKYHDKASVKFEYDDAGRIKKKIEAENTNDEIITDYFYDDFGREKRVYVFSSNSNSQTYFFYDSRDSINNFNLSDVHNVSTVLSELENLFGKLYCTVYNTSDPIYRRIVNMSSFDEEGRVKSSYKWVKELGWEKTSFTYDLQDKVLSKTITSRYLESEEKSYVFRNNYDTKIIATLKSSSLDGEGILYSYDYSLDGNLDTIKYGSTGIKTNFTYTIKDWKKGIYTPGLYNEILDYSGDYIGNIKNIVHEYPTTSKSFDLDYNYDDLSRLTNVLCNNTGNHDYSEAFKYDANSRILNKEKNTDSILATGPDYVYTDHESKPVETHRLKAVTSKLSSGDNDENYVYDKRGNMIRDRLKHMKVKYDLNDMPITFEFYDDDTNAIVKQVNMVYDGGGNRILKEEIDHANSNRTGTAYGSGLVYKNSDLITDKYSLDYVNIGGGRLNVNKTAKDHIYYYLKDHLGSTRATFDADGEPVELTMYDSYGSMENIFKGGTENIREKFTTKEFDSEGEIAGVTDGMGLYYFGARYYDASVGYWVCTDPAKQFYSPYSYSGNGLNPLNAIDPDGNEVTVIVSGITMYVARVASSPDTPYDMEMLAMDISKNDYFGAAGDLIGLVLAGVPASSTRFFAKKIEGIYEFVDATGKKYIGQSLDVLFRLLTHKRKGKIKDGTIVVIKEIPGGITAREVAETKRLLEVTKGKHPKQVQDLVSNKVLPVGEARKELLKE